MGGGAGLAHRRRPRGDGRGREARLSRRRGTASSPRSSWRTWCARWGARRPSSWSRSASRSTPQRALELGMVNFVFSAKDLLPESLKIAEKLAAVSRPAMTRDQAPVLRGGRPRARGGARRAAARPTGGCATFKQSEAARRAGHPRPVARAGLPVRVDDPGRARRARDQGRAAGQRRRDARLRAAARAGQRLLLRLQPLEGIDHRQPALGRGQADDPRAGAEGRRAGGELSRSARSDGMGWIFRCSHP